MNCLYYCRQGDNIELKYSLRSIEEFLNLPVLIVGGKPDWCHPDFYIPHTTNFGKHGDAHAHLATGLNWLGANEARLEQLAQEKQKKIQALLQNKKTHSTRILLNQDIRSAGADEASDFGIEPDDDLCVMMDDIYLAAPFWVNHSKGTLRECWKSSVARYGKNGYNEILRKTMEFLETRGISDPICYDSHSPFFCNRKKVLETFRLMGNQHTQLAWRSIYGNIYKVKHVPAQDVKFRRNDKVRLYSVMSSTDRELEQVLPVLQRRFSEKSRHEFEI